MGNPKDDFREAFLKLLQKRKDELGYRANRVYGKLAENNGDAVETAQWVLGHSGEVSEGLTILWREGRLDLSVQALVLEPRFEGLFTEEERAQARELLDDLSKNPPPRR